MKILQSLTVAQRAILTCPIFACCSMKHSRKFQNSTKTNKDARSVIQKHLEIGVMKTLEAPEIKTRITRIVPCERLKTVIDDNSDSVTEENEHLFATTILQKRRKKRADSFYMNCQFLQPTSNLIELFFLQYSRSHFKSISITNHPRTSQRSVVSEIQEIQRSVLEP